MSNSTPNQRHSYTTGIASNNFTLLTQVTNMPQLSSEEVILVFLYETDLPLRPKSIYGGLIDQQSITFSYRTVQNKVKDLYEAGDIKKVKIDEGAGEIVDVAPDESYRRAYYRITEQGRERVENEILD